MSGFRDFALGSRRTPANDRGKQDQLDSRSQAWASLLTLTALEIVLGIDNVIFISIAAAGLSEKAQRRARVIGLSGALVFRIVLLASIVGIIGLTKPIFEVFGHAVSWRDLILLLGGLILLAKATIEIHHRVEAPQAKAGPACTEKGSAECLARSLAYLGGGRSKTFRIATDRASS